MPTGALIGLDAVRAAAEGAIHSVTMVTRKPPAGLDGAPYLVARGISLTGLKAPLKVFSGTAREGARGFPTNVNVAAALSLAGIGPDRTELEIWADPAVTRNTHTIAVEADATQFHMTIESVPSANPRTGKLVAPSVSRRAARSGVGAQGRKLGRAPSFAHGDHLLGRGNAGDISAVRGGEIVFRTGFAGKEQAIVDRGGELGAASDLARQRI